MSFKEFIEYCIWPWGSDGDCLQVWEVGKVIVILGAIRLLIWFISRVVLKPWYKRRQIDVGKQFAITQIIKYVLYIFAFFLSLDAVGITPSVLLASSAALLVGVGLGLQQTFNDLISGLIILIEGSVEVGDIVESDDGLVTRVQKIGLRTSTVVTRNDYVLLVPNSKLVTSKVINWTHFHTPNRFNVEVGVAYSSDVALVKSLLIEAATTHKSVEKNPKPIVQFTSFGNSSLDFQLFFHSREMFRIENVKSDIRFKILELFRANDVEIPFPQQDLWLRNGAGITDK